MSSPALTQTAPFGLSSVQNMPFNLPASPQAMIIGGNPGSWARSASLGQSFQPRDSEMDPAFNEFAALDAVEWFVPIRCYSESVRTNTPTGQETGTRVSSILASPTVIT